MASQGTINPYVNPYKGGPIEGIAAAVKAVRDIYGISTDKAEAALKQAQTRAANTTANTQEATYSLLKDAMDKAKGNQPEAQTPLQAATTQKPSVNVPGYIYDLAANPLTAGMAEGVLKAASSAQGLQNSQIQSQIEQGKAKAQPAEIAQNLERPATEAKDKFLADTKENRQNIDSYQGIMKDLNSGNIVNEKTALNSLALKKTGISRLNEEAQKSAESQQILENWKQDYKFATDGHLLPESIDRATRAAKSGISNEFNAINSAADNTAGSFANSKSNVNGLDAQSYKYKTLLPGYFQKDVFDYANKNNIAPETAAVYKLNYLPNKGGQ